MTPLLTEDEAYDFTNVFDKLNPDEQLKAGPLLELYKQNQEEQGLPLFPRREEAQRLEQQKFTSVFSDIDTITEYSPELKQAISTSADPEGTKLIGANVLYMAKAMGRPVQEVALEYPDLMPQFAAQVFNKKVEDNRTFYALASIDVLKKVRTEDARSEASRLALRSAAMGTYDSASDYQEWRGGNKDVKLPVRAHTAFSEAYSVAAERVRPYRSLIQGAVEALQGSRTGEQGMGGAEKETADLIVELPAQDRQLVIASIMAGAEAKGKALNKDWTFWQQTGESFGRLLEGSFAGIGSAELDRATSTLRSEMNFGRFIAPADLSTPEKAKAFVKSAMLATLAEQQGTSMAESDVRRGEARELSLDEQKLVLSEVNKIQRRAQLGRQVRQASVTSDPVKNVYSSAIGSSLAILPTVAAGPGGLVLASQMYAGMEYDDLRVKYPTLPVEKARAIAGISGFIQAGLDKITVGFLGDKLPSLRNLVQGGIMANVVGRMGIRTVEGMVIENSVEGAQDITTPIVTEIMGRLMTDVPQVDWESEKKNFWSTRADVALGTLPLVLLGVGVAGINDYGRMQTKVMLGDADGMEAAGFAPDDITRVTGLAENDDLRGAHIALREAMVRRDPAIAKQYAERAESGGTGAADFDSALSRVTPKYIKEGGTHTITFPDGKTIKAESWEEARWYVEQIVGDTMAQEIDVVASMADFLSKPRAGLAGRTVEVDLGTGRKQQQDVDEGIITEEQALERAYIAGEAYNMTPEEAKNTAWGVLGRNVLEMKGKVARAASKYFRGANILTATEEEIEINIKEGLVNGRHTVDKLAGWVRRAEAVTKQTFLRVEKGKEVTEQAVIEAISEILVADIVGQRKDGSKLPAGLVTRGVARAIQSRQRVGRMKKDKDGNDTDEKGSEFAAFLEAWRQFFRQIFQKAKAITRAKEQGLLGSEYQDYVDELLGVTPAAKDASASAKQALEMAGLNPELDVELEQELDAERVAPTPFMPVPGQVAITQGEGSPLLLPRHRKLSKNVVQLEGGEVAFKVFDSTNRQDLLLRGEQAQQAIDAMLQAAVDVEASGGKVSYSIAPPAQSAPQRVGEDFFQQPGKFYRVVVGDDAFQDIVDTGEVRTNAAAKVAPGASLMERLAGRPTAFPSFSKDSAAMLYARDNPNHYIIVSSDSSLQPSQSGRHSKGKTMFPTDAQGNHMMSLSGEKVSVYKPVGDGQYELVYDKGSPVASGTTNVNYSLGVFQEATSNLPAKPTEADLETWREENQSKYQQLKDLKNRILEKAGFDIEANHGTTHNFNRFLRSRANVENDMGAGFYLSNSMDDVETNYAGVGPDLTNRIENLASMLQMDESLSLEEATEEATRQLRGDTVRVINARIRFTNPVVLDGSGNGNQGTMIELMPSIDSYRDEAVEQIRDENPEMTDDNVDEFEDQITDRMYELQGSDMGYNSGVEIIRRVVQQFEDTEWSEVSEDLVNWDGEIPAYRLDQLLRESSGSQYAADDNGNSAVGELIRQVFEELGYDGVIDKTVYDKFGKGRGMVGVQRDTIHYIAFESNQIKSTEPLNLDDQGDLITPDKWADTTSENISYSIAPSRINPKAPSGVRANRTEALPTWTLPKDNTSLPKTLDTAKVRKALYARLDEALAWVREDPTRIATPAGWVKYLRKAGVWGEVPMPPSGLMEVYTNPTGYLAKLNGGYHGERSLPDTQTSAMQGMDGTVEMRQLIGEGKAPAPFVVALHHLWGILSRMLSPIDQEGMWLRLIAHRPVLDTIQSSIDGTFNLDLEGWKQLIQDARADTSEGAGPIGNAATSNANSFYLMLERLNGRWSEMADVYASTNSREMGRKFWDIGAGKLGIKNKVQRFIGLTFGIPGVIMDRWKFVEFWLPTAMQGTGATSTPDYFSYQVNTPSDDLGIYGVYGGVDSNNETLSLAMYEAFEVLLEEAIAKSPELKQHLGNHANAGGMHWFGWNAIKNEAVGHSSLDLTKELISTFGVDIDAEKVHNTINNGSYFTEGSPSQGVTVKFTLDKGTVRVESTGLARRLQRGSGGRGRGGRTAAGNAPGSRAAQGTSGQGVGYSIAPPSFSENVQEELSRALDFDPDRRRAYFNEVSKRIAKVADEVDSMAAADLTPKERKAQREQYAQNRFTELMALLPPNQTPEKQKEVRKQANADAEAWSKKNREDKPSQRDRIIMYQRVLNAGLMGMNPALRGKVGGYLNVARAQSAGTALKAIKKAVVKMGEVIERELKAEYTSEVKDILKKGKIRTRAGQKPKSDIGAEATAVFQMAKEVMEFDEATVIKEVGAREAQLLDPSLVLTPEERQKLEDEISILETFGNSSDWTAAEAKAAYDTLEEVYSKGYLERKLRADVIKQEVERLRTLLKDSTGITDIEAALIKAQNADNLFSRLTMGLLDFNQFVYLIFGENSVFTRELLRMDRLSDNAKVDLDMATEANVEAFFTALAGGQLEGQKLRYQLATKKTVVTADNQTFTQMEAIHILATWRQEKGKKHMLGKLGPAGASKNPPTWGYDQAWVDAVEAQVSDEAKAVLGFLSQQLRDEHPVLDALMREREGVALPQEAFYFILSVMPLTVKAGAMIDPVTGKDVTTVGLTPSFLRNRSSTSVNRPVFRDALQLYLNHARQANHWIARYDFARTMQQLFLSQSTLDYVRGVKGEYAAGKMRKFVDWSVQGGVRSAASDFELNNFISRMAGRAASAAILGRVTTLGVQTTQLAAGILKMPLSTFLRLNGKLYSGELDWSAAYNSQFIQRRVLQKSPLVRQAMEDMIALQAGKMAGRTGAVREWIHDKQGPNALKHQSRHLADWLSKTDGFATAATYTLIYHHKLEEAATYGMGPAEASAWAVDEAERLTEDISQPVRQSQRSLFELHSTNLWAGKAFFAFASEPRKKVALLMMALERGVWKDPAYVAKLAVLVFGVNGLGVHALKLLSGTARGTADEEDWTDWQSWATAMITAPLAGFPGAQALMETGSLLSGPSRAMGAMSRMVSGESFEDIPTFVKDMELLLTAMALVSDDAAAASAFSHLAADAVKVIDTWVSEN